MSTRDLQRVAVEHATAAQLARNRGDLDEAHTHESVALIAADVLLDHMPLGRVRRAVLRAALRAVAWLHETRSPVARSLVRGIVRLAMRVGSD